MRNLTMADGCLDAPRRRMKRLEFWLVLIDAEHMASDLESAPPMPLHLTSFSRFRKFVRHNRHQFHSGRLVGACRNRNLRSRGVSRYSCSRTTGGLKAACASDSYQRSQSRHEEPASDRVVSTRFLFDAFSSREAASTSLENAIIRPPAPSRGTCRPRA